MKIFISHSTDYDFKDKIYKPIKDSKLWSLHNFFLPHHQEQINTKKIICDSDIVIAEVSLPSTGQGVELGWADCAKVPIFCFYEKDKNVSSSLKFLAREIIEYENSDDLVNKITQVLNNFNFTEKEENVKI